MTFRKNVGNFNIDVTNESQSIISKIDQLNKEINVNLIVLNINLANKIGKILKLFN